MRVLVVGSSGTFYVRGYISIFLEKCCEVALLDVGSSDYANDGLLWHRKNSKYSSHVIVKLIKYLLWMFGVRDLTFFQKARRFFRKKGSFLPREENSFDVVFYFWGTTLMDVCKETMRRYPEAKHVLAVNTYPTGFSNQHRPTKVEIKYFSSFDLLLTSTQLMQKYLKTIGIKKASIQLVPDLIWKKYNFGSKSQIIPPRKVAFLGNVDFTQRATDDVRRVIEKLEGSYGLEVWTQGDGGASLKQFSGFNFDAIHNGELNKYLHANFDAVLYIYNSSGSVRESMSLTTRFSLYEGCGLPLIISKSTYPGIWEEFSSCYDFIDLDMLPISEFSSSKHNYWQKNRVDSFFRVISNEGINN